MYLKIFWPGICHVITQKGKAKGLDECEATEQIAGQAEPHSKTLFSVNTTMAFYVLQSKEARTGRD